MNSVYNHAVKQVSTLQKEITQFENNITTSPLSLQGTIAANLSTLTKTLDQYESLAKNEIDEAKKSKAELRLQNFRNEIKEARSKFQELKRKRDYSLQEANKSELLNRRPHGGAATASDNPFEAQQHQQSLQYSEGLNKENSILNRGNQQLDEILQMGREAYEELVASNEMLRGFQNKLVGTLGTLGLSQQTIRTIEKRAFQDKWIFYGGAIIMFLLFYYMLKWFR